MITNRQLFSLKTAFISLVFAIFLLFLASFKLHNEIWNVQFIICFFLGSYSYGYFGYDKQKAKFIFLILAVILWMLSISVFV